mmetsp:Transcript_67508/g.150706  ORF Transcript_67508/g.150706 Transcript_67508/m.150706 type:complete len:96 (-) Transcript_67508:1107-1394(-)
MHQMTGSYFFLTLRLSTKGSAKALCSALPFSAQAAAAVENGSAMGWAAQFALSQDLSATVGSFYPLIKSPPVLDFGHGTRKNVNDNVHLQATGKH